MPTERFTGCPILVTGAGSGIGRALALRFAREGARLLLLGRRPAPLAQVAREIAAAGGSPALTLACDVRQPGAVETALAEVTRRSGPLFACIANAGIGGPNTPGAPGAPGTVDRFDELVATNLNGTYHTLRAAQRNLGPGPAARHLVVVSSILARLGVAGYTGYCASKAGLLGLVRALAQELARENVQVNAVLPGWVETEMAQEGLAGMAQALGTDVAGARRAALAQVPLGRFAEPEDVAGLVAWLCSPDARGVTGAALDINNGALMS